MAYRFIALVPAAFFPLIASAFSPVAVVDMYPYVDGRDFPVGVPLIGFLLLGLYLVRTLIAYRMSDKAQLH